MAKLTIDGREIEAAEGAPLVEVIKNSGTFISNLCYVNGRPPYAGCRTCLVEIEGARGLQLSCTSPVRDGMIVVTDSPTVKQARQATLSLILSYHSDRCLTCHREVKCKPGDTCLRDNVVTHRCVTCSKNYRCELQTTCEMLEMAGYEPWEGEERTYYQTPQPEPDHGNPFLEFDPQMCIICTRCVRTCDETRHTGAITLGGKGFDARIEFGAGGPVHESNCDFCGSCIDVCPTAALMEHPNKWSATQTERWVPTTCTQCSVGCTINLGVKNGRGVIVRPDTEGNPVSNDQLCVRGRFHYDAIKASDRLAQPLLRRDGGFTEASWEEALDATVDALARIRDQHGASAIAFLGSPLVTNEENYLLQKLARAVVGSNNVDSSAGPMASAVAGSLRNSFGSDVLPADMQQLAQSKVIVAVAEDMESSHNVAALRIKDAVVREGAKLIVVSPRWGELCDFADVWLKPGPGQEAELLARMRPDLAAAQPPEDLARARQILSQAVGAEERPMMSFVFSVPHLGPSRAAEVSGALANLAIACVGQEAASSLFVLPQEANVWGMRDAGVRPDLADGRGLGFDEMLARCGQDIRAMVVLADNPMFFAADQSAVAEALGRLDFLAVIDTVLTDTAQLAHVVLPEAGPYAKEGTTTSADRRVLRLHQATAPAGAAQPGWHILVSLGERLTTRFGVQGVRTSYAGPSEVMAEMAEALPLYRNARYEEMENGSQQTLDGAGPGAARLQHVEPVAADPAGDGLLLLTGRSLYISYEGAAIHSPNADRLHRDEFVGIHPEDAHRLGIAADRMVGLRNSRGGMSIRAKLTTAVSPGTVFVPLHYDGGAVTALFGPDQASARVQIAPAAD